MRRLTEADELELMELLPAPMQQAVARGDVELAALLEYVTSSRTAELCPRCVARPVSDRYKKLGLCAPCARTAMNEAFLETIATLEAKRDGARKRKQVQRLRDEIDPERTRRGK